MGPWSESQKRAFERLVLNESILCKCDKSNLFPRCDRNPDYCTKRSNVAEATARDQR